MTIEMVVAIIGIIGGLLTILLSINAFYFKDMVKSLKAIELEFAKLSTEHGRIVKDVDNLLSDMQKTRDRLHKLEGREWRLEEIVKLFNDSLEQNNKGN